MVITWYGEGCFKVQTGGLTVLTDPFDASTGLTPPRFKPDITLRTTTPWPLKSSFGAAVTEGDDIVGPGEYEIRELSIKSWPIGMKTENDVTRGYYAMIAEGMKLVFLGGLAAGMPEVGMVENVSAADILFVPAGGPPLISLEDVATLIKQLSPKIVVAAFFKTPGLARKALDAKALFKELGQEPTTYEKLTVKRSDLPTRLRVVALTT